MKTIRRSSVALGYAMFTMVVLVASAEEESKTPEVNVRAILRSDRASELAGEVAKQLNLKQSAKASNGFNDLERPSVDFRAFTMSFTIDNASGNRGRFPVELARSIAHALNEAGAKGGNLDSYLAPKTPAFSEPRLHYRRGNVQGFFIIQMSNTKGNTEGVSIVCYEHVLAASGIAEQAVPPNGP